MDINRNSCRCLRKLGTYLYLFKFNVHMFEFFTITKSVGTHQVPLIYKMEFNLQLLRVRWILVHMTLITFHNIQKLFFISGQAPIHYFCINHYKTDNHCLNIFLCSNYYKDSSLNTKNVLLLQVRNLRSENKWHIFTHPRRHINYTVLQKIKNLTPFQLILM